VSLARIFGRTDSPAVTAEEAETIVQRLFKHHPEPAFSVRLWNGRFVTFGLPARFTLCFEDHDTFVNCVGSGDPSEFAEAYVDARIRIEGDLGEAVKLLSYLSSVKLDLISKLSVTSKLDVRPARHTVRSDTRNVQAHYDLSDDFFRLFLDERMVYSCAYFVHEDDSLDDAQAHKLDLICRKLRLTAGEKLLDIGCGWGALVIWAAEHYGVRATGITLSARQEAEARRRVQKAGLGGRVAIHQGHYSELPEAAYDKVASVGMYEHVGLEKLPVYFRKIHASLRPGGLLLNHGVTVPSNREGLHGGAFLARHVFPGGEVDGLPHLQALMEAEGFEIVDVESLRRHYALTLAEWHRRYKAARSRAAKFVPEKTLRAWDLYLAGAAHAFDEGILGVHQVLAAKPDHGRTAVPLTRNDLLVE
jgi:cyclopropane-fatty-acyl-phospholipid synthase